MDSFDFMGYAPNDTARCSQRNTGFRLVAVRDPSAIHKFYGSVTGWRDDIPGILSGSPWPEGLPERGNHGVVLATIDE
jgi:hypothetical protein